MPNPDNIKPYSDLAHKASQAGGPEKFINTIAENNYSMGYQDGKEQQSLCVTIAALLSAGVTAGVVTLWRKHKEKKLAKRLALEKEAKEAKEAFLDHMNNLDDEEEE